MKKWLLIYVFAIPAVCNAFSSSDITCPAEIVTHQSIIKTPTGFSAAVFPTEHYLEKITFYNGMPSRKVSLAPDNENKKNMTWTFSKNENIYISCGYHQTIIELFKSLPKNIQSCTINYDVSMQGSFGGVPRKISCR